MLVTAITMDGFINIEIEANGNFQYFAIIASLSNNEHTTEKSIVRFVLDEL